MLGGRGGTGLPVGEEDVVAGGGAAGGGVDLELVEGVAPGGGALSAVHPDVAAGPGDRQGLDASGAGGRLVDRRPVGSVAGDLQAVALGVRGLPVEDDLSDRGARAEVDTDPLVVGEAAGPAGGGVAVDGGRGREGGLRAGGGGRLSLGDENGRGGGPFRGHGHREGEQEGHGGHDRQGTAQPWCSTGFHANSLLCEGMRPRERSPRRGERGRSGVNRQGFRLS